MKHIEYPCSGTCSKAICLDLDDELRVHNVQFVGGCSGNTQGVSSLVENMSARDVIARLGGIRCGYKVTSCPDQLSRALSSSIA